MTVADSYKALRWGACGLGVGLMLVAQAGLALACLYEVVLSLWIAYHAGGVALSVLSFVAFPLMLYWPLHAAFAWGFWWPLGFAFFALGFSSLLKLLGGCLCAWSGPRDAR